MALTSEHLSAYKSACEDHPELKAFDAELQQRTSKVLDAMTVGAETEPLSLQALHMEVSNHLYQVTDSVAKFITESKTDVWENEALRSLVEAYFNNTVKTLEIFNTVMDCVEKAEMGQLLILKAGALFDKQSSEKGVKEKNYEKVLKKLKKFKAMGDPFGDQLLKTQFELIKKQHESLLEEVGKLITKLKEESNHLEEEIKISNAVLGAAISATVVGRLANMTTGEKVAMGFASIVSPMIVLGWISVHDSLKTIKELEEAQARLNEQKDALTKLQKQEKIAKSVEKGVVINKQATMDVSLLVDQLETKIKSILGFVEEAIDDEEDGFDPNITMKTLKKKVNECTEKIKEVGKNVAERSVLIFEARKRVMEKIAEKNHVV